MKIFIYNFAFFAIPIMIILSFVNYFGDAGNLFSGIEVQIAKYITDGYNVKNVYNINERSLERNIINLSNNIPQVIVIGSSRIMLIGSKYSNGSIMNHGVSGCSIEDMIAIYQLYKNKGALPHKIIIGIDPWIFNKNNDQNRWETLKNEYYSFFTHKIATNFDWSKYFQLFSFSYFRPSLIMLKNRMLGSTKISPTDNVNNLGDTSARLKDGTIFYEKEYRNASLKTIEDNARSYIATDIYSLEKYDSFSESDIRIFDLFIQQLLSEKIELEFVLMPYHPIVYDFLATNNKYKIIVTFENYIKDYALKKNINIIGSLNPAQYKLGNAHFYDGMHLNEIGVSIVLNRNK